MYTYSYFSGSLFLPVTDLTESFVRRAKNNNNNVGYKRIFDCPKKPRCEALSSTSPHALPFSPPAAPHVRGRQDVALHRRPLPGLPLRPAGAHPRPGDRSAPASNPGPVGIRAAPRPPPPACHSRARPAPPAGPDHLSAYSFHRHLRFRVYYPAGHRVST